MAYFLSLLMIMTIPGIRVANPTPVGPDFRLVGDSVRFEGEDWSLALKSLSLDEFREHVAKFGVAQSLLATEGLNDRLSNMVFFRIELENQSGDNILFNPDQIILRGPVGPDGVQVDMANFWPMGPNDGRREQERFARVFSRGTVELAPGKTHTHLAVFRPIRKRFKKKVLLQIHRVYHGVQVHNLECGFEIRRPKK